MDASAFDTLARSFVTSGTRRRALARILSGSLAVMGVAGPAEAKAKSGKCKPACGECQTCKRGDCDKKHGKKRCEKGKCRPKTDGTACSFGSCQGGQCQSPPAPICLDQGTPCQLLPSATPCCTGVCYQDSPSFTAPTCVPCRTPFALCHQHPNPCCPPRSCVPYEMGGIPGCCSLLGESCGTVFPDPVFVSGTCCGAQANPPGVICPPSGPSALRCCIAIGNPAPGGCPADGTHASCCNLTCDAVADLCT